MSKCCCVVLRISCSGDSLLDFLPYSTYLTDSKLSLFSVGPN